MAIRSIQEISKALETAKKKLEPQAPVAETKIESRLDRLAKLLNNKLNTFEHNLIFEAEGKITKQDIDNFIKKLTDLEKTFKTAYEAKAWTDLPTESKPIKADPLKDLRNILCKLRFEKGEIGRAHV